MARLKDAHLAQAYRIMHARGITTDTLADELVTARTYVSRVIGGYERRGAVWVRIQRILAERAPEALEELLAMDVSALPVQQTAVRMRREPAPVVPFAGQPKNHQAAPTMRRFNQWRQERAHA
jgi:DNA-binding transcriptional regulator LsrR (DeoR family)